MKNSLLYLRENLMWTSTGTVWAMWRVHGLPYGFGKGEHKERAMLAHQALFQGPVSYTHLTLPTIYSV